MAAPTPEMLEAEIARLRHAVEARDAFLAAVAHELRTPIGTMLLHVEGARQLAANSGSDALTTRLDALGRQMLQFSRRATTLLDVSALAVGKLKLHAEPGTDVADATRNALELLAPEAIRAGSGVSLDVHGETVGDFDRVRLEQIVLNLVGNAIKYGAGKPIAVTVQGVGDDVRIVVRDNGIGIRDEDRRRVFGRFERAPQLEAGETPSSGFGVGLWIVEQIVDAMSGTIQMTSQLGSGSEFTVTLPKQRGEG